MKAQLALCKKERGFEVVPVQRQLKAVPDLKLIGHNPDNRYYTREGDLWEVGDRRARKIGKIMGEYPSRYEAEMFKKSGNKFHWKRREHRLFTMQMDVLPEGIMRFAPGRDFEKVLVIDPQEYKPHAPIAEPGKTYEQVCRRRR